MNLLKLQFQSIYNIQYLRHFKLRCLFIVLCLHWIFCWNFHLLWLTIFFYIFMTICNKTKRKQRENKFFVFCYVNKILLSLYCSNIRCRFSFACLLPLLMNSFWKVVFFLEPLFPKIEAYFWSSNLLFTFE